jgi:hypothetical protein
VRSQGPRKPEAAAGATRGEMSASGAVQPGHPGAAVGPSPAAAASPATGPLFRPLSAEDEEQQPTEIESLCMNCYRNVSLSPGNHPAVHPEAALAYRV